MVHHVYGMVVNQNIIQLLYGSGLEDIYDKEMFFGICIGSLWV